MPEHNYAREAGHLAGTLSGLAYTPISQGLVKYDDYEKVKQICEDAIKAARERAND
jgi:hypothetical protein